MIHNLLSMPKINTIHNIDLLIAKFNAALNRDPYNPELYANLAGLYYKINNIAQAIYYYKRSLYLDPNNSEVHYKLANSYVAKNAVIDAINQYRACLALNASHIYAMQNLGMLLVTEEQFAEALPYLEQAFLHNIETHNNSEFIEQLANCYLQTGNINKSIELLKAAIIINPNKESLQHNLAILYLREDDYINAKEHFVNCLAINPSNHTAAHMLAALSEETTKQAPAKYIIDLFNQYAGYYNQHVTEKLQYKLPEQFRSLYAKYCNTVTSANTLDLGCGTGLCSVYFRDATANLIGVDLSKNMLLQARDLGAYDLLIQADLQENNIFINNYFDLIIAADIIPYMGDLENLFNNISSLVKSDKFLFIFNIEINNNLNNNFILQHTGRYAHSKNYINMMANKFKFKIIENLEIVIRVQNNMPVNGILFVLNCC